MAKGQAHPLDDDIPEVGALAGDCLVTTGDPNEPVAIVRYIGARDVMSALSKLPAPIIDALDMLDVSLAAKLGPPPARPERRRPEIPDTEEGHRVRLVLPRGPGGRDSLPGPHRGGPYGAVFLATCAIPAAGVRAGDVVMRLMSPQIDRPERDGVRGTILRVPRDAFPALEAEMASLAFVTSSWPDTGEAKHRGKLAQYLKLSHARHVARGGSNDSSSLVVILRPFLSPSSNPIEAENDDEAIDRLIRGCEDDSSPDGEED